MKKNLFFISVAVLALSSCNNDTVVDENLSANQPKEIAFQAITTPTTRAAVNGTTFPTDVAIKVAAYDITAGADYFEPTSFSNVESTTTWKGNRYWPFTAATINFLAYSEFDNVTPTWDEDHPVNSVSLVLGNNKTDQNDLMFATGTGSVSQDGNALSYPDNVTMQFKHAQAWVLFNVQAGNSTSADVIKVNSITLNEVSCQGTYTVTYGNYTTTETPSLTKAWSDYSSYKANVPVIVTGSSTLTTSSAAFGNLMVVPDQGIKSFTINYELDGNTYDYTYTLDLESLNQATKYIYDITLSVHEIIINATVTDWTAATTPAVSI